MEDLPLSRTAALVPEFGVKDLTLRRILMILYIQGVTGPHRQNDRDDRPCREDHFFVKEHILANMSFLSYAHVSRCARHALEQTDEIMVCAVGPHSVIAIHSA